MKDREFEAALEDIKSRIKEVEQYLTKKKGPVVPWVGANCLRETGRHYGAFVWDDECTEPESAIIQDSLLHPQFMPNDGVNPWPDDMRVNIMLESGNVILCRSRDVAWENTRIVLGSRPACGWAEYMKEREQ